MHIKSRKLSCKGTRLSAIIDGKESGRIYLYIMKNDLHKVPFGLLEDLFVEESARGKGIGTGLIGEAVKLARKGRCYKLIATSRHQRKEVHKLYKRIGFRNHGIEFRMDF